MAQTVNLAYKAPITSAGLNQKTNDLVGTNGVLKGYNVTAGTGSTLSVGLGNDASHALMINGATISDTASVVATLTPVNVSGATQYGVIYMSYVHGTDAAGTIVLAMNTLTVPSNVTCCKLAEITVPSGFTSSSQITIVNMTEQQTMSDLQIQSTAAVKRETIPSGFLSLSDLDYAFMATTPNTIKTLTDMTANVNGFSVTIPAGTIIPMNPPPTTGTRDDLVFLEVWIDANTKKINSRARVVDGVDFAGYTLDGFTTTTISGTSSQYDKYVTPQGGLASPLLNDGSKGWDSEYVFNDVTKRYAWNRISPNDAGLYVAGRGDLNAKTTLATYDGYVYAIPMFKVHRRNSGGYSVSNANGGSEVIINISRVTLAVGINAQMVVNKGYSALSIGQILYTTSNTSSPVLQVISKDGGNLVTFKNVFTTTINNVTADHFIKSSRPDNMSSEIIADRDILDLRHQVSLTGFNYQELLEENFDKLMRSELLTKDKTKMLKTYHGICKTPIDANTVFYASLDGTTVAEVGGAPTITGTSSYIPSPTGLSLIGKGVSGVYPLVVSSPVITLDFFIRRRGTWPDYSIYPFYLRNVGSAIISNIDNLGSTLRFMILGVVRNTIFIPDDGVYHHVRYTINDTTLMSSIYLDGKLISNVSYVALIGVNTIASMTVGSVANTTSDVELADISISNIDRGAVFATLPQDFIDGYARIMPAFNEQRQIYSDALTSELQSELVKASGETKRQFTITQATQGTWTCPIKQVITNTVVGTITTLGNATAIVTAVGMTGTPRTVSVAVALNDTATIVAGKVVTALNADVNVNAKFTASNVGAVITLTALTALANDTTMNLSVANGTCVGLTLSNATITTTGNGVADTLALKGIAGEIISGVIDSDTALAKLIANIVDYSASVDDVSKFSVGDSIIMYNTSSGTITTGRTITAIDTTNKILTITPLTATGSDFASIIFIETTASTSSPLVKTSLSGTATAGSTTTITLPATFSAIDSAYNGLTLKVTGGTGVGQYCAITSYIGATKVATIPVQLIALDATSTFTITGVPVIGTWSSLGTNQATFTLGINALLTNQDLSIDYSLNEIAGQGGIQEVLTATLGGETSLVSDLVTNADFVGKVSGDVVANPNILHLKGGSSILTTPNDAQNVEYTTVETARINLLDSILLSRSEPLQGSIPQHLFSFNLIEIFERKYGKIPPSTVAGKVAWLKANLSAITCNWTGFGSCPSGNKATFVPYKVDTANYYSADSGNTKTNSAPAVYVGGLISASMISGSLDTNGFVHFLAYTDMASTTSPTLLVLTAHGLSNLDVIENSTRGNLTSYATSVTANAMVTSSITGQASGDIINKYRRNVTVASTTGTTSTNLVINSHGLSTGDYAVNNTRGLTSKVTVVDANTLTLTTAITGQVSGDSISLYHYTGQQTAEATVIPSTINTDYVQLAVTMKTGFEYNMTEVKATIARTTSKLVLNPAIHITDDFVGKVTGSVIENPNAAKYGINSALLIPSGAFGEYPQQGQYDMQKLLDGTSMPIGSTTDKAIPQQLFSFNLIEIVERKYGKIPALDKVAWLKDNISIIKCNWTGFGLGPLGNKANFTIFASDYAGGWVTATNMQTSNNNNAPSKLSFSTSSPKTTIDANGFVHFLAYTDMASTTSPTLLVLTAHGLVGTDAIENVTRGVIMYIPGATVITANAIPCPTIPNQASGDIINKFRKYNYTATTLAGTTDTNIVIANHGLLVGDLIISNAIIRKVLTVIDTNTVTVATGLGAVVGTTGIMLHHYVGQQTAEATVIPSTINTDYVSLDITLKTPTGYDILAPENVRRDAGQSNIISVRKETKEIQALFTASNAGGIVTYGDYTPKQGMIPPSSLIGGYSLVNPKAFLTTLTTKAQGMIFNPKTNFGFLDEYSIIDSVINSALTDGSQLFNDYVSLFSMLVPSDVRGTHSANARIDIGKITMISSGQMSIDSNWIAKFIDISMISNGNSSYVPLMVWLVKDINGTLYLLVSVVPKSVFGKSAYHAIVQPNSRILAFQLKNKPLLK